MTLAYATLRDFECYVSGAEFLMDEETGGFWERVPSADYYMNTITGEILY